MLIEVKGLEGAADQEAALLEEGEGGGAMLISWQSASARASGRARRLIAIMVQCMNI